MKDLPPLPLAEWRDTLETLHRWMQIVGKVRLAFTPLVNHWWNVPFYVSARGLTTSAIPIGERMLELEFDFIEEMLRVRPTTGPEEWVALRPRSVAEFYAATMEALRAADVQVNIWTTPVEIADPIPFEQDFAHASYDKEYALRFWQILRSIDPVFGKFRSGFIGKCSPVQFFWGSFDMTVTRFSGRRAPPFAGTAVDREAYSHEVCSVGWWPGDERLPKPSFYAYAAPEPPGYRDALIPERVPGAYYNTALKGWYLDYDEVRLSDAPEKLLLDFCKATYASAAELGGWPRKDLERQPEERHGDVYASWSPGQQASPDDRL